ncbi:MAG: TIGR03987 family protein [Devosiaceae bacterium]|nr:TIGR03987 family protein [Devosiaceae bacterium]
MSTLLFYGVVLFTVALVFYSISVWAGWFSKRLKLWHIYVFLIGLFTDFLATLLTYLDIGGIVITLHSVLGFISIILMFIHVVWAVIIFRSGNENLITNFHKISLFVWGIWMISYISGAYLGIVMVV